MITNHYVVVRKLRFTLVQGYICQKNKTNSCIIRNFTEYLEIENSAIQKDMIENCPKVITLRIHLLLIKFNERYTYVCSN